MSALRSADRAGTRRPGLDHDLVRQLIVAASAVVALFGLLVGLGTFGGPQTEEAAGGSLTSTATLIAPAGPAFSIWTPIYAGLLALGAWQLAPSRRQDSRQRGAGWWIALTMLANATWLLVVQAGWIWVSVAVIALLLVALGVVAARLSRTPPGSRTEAVLVDGTMGVYLGWVCVASIANVAAALVATGTAAIGAGAVAATVVMLGVAAAVGWTVVATGAARWWFAAAMSWGLAWIAVARVQGPTESPTVAVVAGVAAVSVLVAPVVFRARH